jgi:hypothetical protein
MLSFAIPPIPVAGRPASRLLVEIPKLTVLLGSGSASIIANGPKVQSSVLELALLKKELLLIVTFNISCAPQTMKHKVKRAARI